MILTLSISFTLSGVVFADYCWLHLPINPSGAHNSLYNISLFLL